MIRLFATEATHSGTAVRQQNRFRWSQVEQHAALCDLRGLRAKWRIKDPELQTDCPIKHFSFTSVFWVITLYSLVGGTRILINMLLPI